MCNFHCLFNVDFVNTQNRQMCVALIYSRAVAGLAHFIYIYRLADFSTFQAATVAPPSVDSVGKAALPADTAEECATGRPLGGGEAAVTADGPI